MHYIRENINVMNPLNHKMASLFVSAVLFLFTTFLPSRTLGDLQKPTQVTGGNETDRLALLDFKSMILEDPQGALNSWNDSLHFCDWEGVKCGRKHRRVSTIDLSSRDLKGSLSPHIGNLSFLRMIRLINNTFEGPIPSEIGHLFRLQYLFFDNNTFQGEIPTSISNCSNLIFLDVGRNRLVGQIPKELNSLTKLTDLWLDGNHLTGEIPPLGNLSSLQHFYATGNNLTGTLPDAFGQLDNLSFLGAAVNELSGTIPLSICNLTSLSVLSLSSNNLSGTFPPCLGSNQPYLQRIQLDFNQFTGPLPPSLSNASQLERIGAVVNFFEGKISLNFANMQNLNGIALEYNNLGSGEHDEMNFVHSLANCSLLQVLSLADNQLRGALPDNVVNFSTNLFYLDLSGNHIYGGIPSWIAGLFNLSTLSLSTNEFTGAIPSNIGNLQKLQFLRLDSNGLSEELPYTIGNLSLLNYLRLDYNRLHGNLPSSLGNCTNLLSLDLSQNNFSGTIPSQIFGIHGISISLNLSWNQFFGSLPPEVGNLNKLAALDISHNGMSGEIPDGLSGCTSLEILSLEYNFLQGSIPSSFSSLRGIQSLDLSHNNFSGQIPEFLGSFSIRNLNLSFNDFEGRVPTKGVFANESAISVFGNFRLCGGISELQLPNCNGTRSNEGKKNLSRKLIIIIVISCVLVGLMMVVLLLYGLRKRMKGKTPNSFMKEPILKVSYERLLKATDGFSTANLIGMGGFGSVYKGILNPEETAVAVKVFDLERHGAAKSFIAECEALRNVRHRNLVRTVTACSSTDFQNNDFKALVYEYMSRGNLESWLHPSQTIDNGEGQIQSLTLHQRINIAIDVACALDYLHNQCVTPVIHCDLKPSNVLLDEDMVARVGDFGLARLLPELFDLHRSSSIGIKGTIGYVAPEFGLGSEVSTSGDIYSYGILLLEMITGKRPTDPLFVGGLNLHNYARLSLPGHTKEVVDPMLLTDSEDEATMATDNIQSSTREQIEKCLISLIIIGVACSMESASDRKDIRNVISELHSIKSVLEGTPNRR